MIVISTVVSCVELWFGCLLGWFACCVVILHGLVVCGFLGGWLLGLKWVC